MPSPSSRERAAQVKAARKALGLPKQASYRQVQEAYHRLSREHHPDRNPAENADDATEQMKEINSAYEVLKHYIEQYPISLDPDTDEEAPFDMEAWWRDRFASPYGQE